MNPRPKDSLVQSAAHVMLYKTTREIWGRGETYADGGKVSVVRWDHRGIEATVAGTSSYQVSLREAGSGFTRRCDCPYASGATSGRICKHLVAVVLAWDARLGLARKGWPHRGQTLPPIGHARVSPQLAYTRSCVPILTNTLDCGLFLYIRAQL